MDSNTHSTHDPTGPTGPGDDLAALTAIVRRLASRDLGRLPDAALGDQTLQLPQLRDCLDGSAAGCLRARLRMASGAATTAVRTARALFRGPLPATGAALCAGELSAAHAEVLAASTLHHADHAIHEAEPTLLEAARRLDPSGLRQVVTHLQYTIDPDRADARAQRRYERRGGVWVTTMDRMGAGPGAPHAPGRR